MLPLVMLCRDCGQCCAKTAVNAAVKTAVNVPRLRSTTTTPANAVPRLRKRDQYHLMNGDRDAARSALLWPDLRDVAEQHHG